MRGSPFPHKSWQSVFHDNIKSKFKQKKGAETVSHTVFGTHFVSYMRGASKIRQLKYPISVKSQAPNITQMGDVWGLPSFGSRDLMTEGVTE